ASEALKGYLGEFPGHVAALREATAAADRGAIEGRAAVLHLQYHEVGALRLAGIASHLELAASGGELSEVLALVAALEDEFVRVADTLREVAEGRLGLVEPRRE